MIESLVSVFPPKSRVQVLESLRATGEQLFDLAMLSGWPTAGQRIVYEEEKRLGFSLARQLCALAEAEFDWQADLRQRHGLPSNKSRAYFGAEFVRCYLLLVNHRHNEVLSQRKATQC